MTRYPQKAKLKNCWDTSVVASPMPGIIQGDFPIMRSTVKSIKGSPKGWLLKGKMLEFGIIKKLCFLPHGTWRSSQGLYVFSLFLWESTMELNIALEGFEHDHKEVEAASIVFFTADSGRPLQSLRLNSPSACGKSEGVIQKRKDIMSFHKLKSPTLKREALAAR